MASGPQSKQEENNGSQETDQATEEVKETRGRESESCCAAQAVLA